MEQTTTVRVTTSTMSLFRQEVTRVHGTLYRHASEEIDAALQRHIEFMRTRPSITESLEQAQAERTNALWEETLAKTGNVHEPEA